MAPGSSALSQLHIPHLLSTRDLDKHQVDYLLQRAAELEGQNDQHLVGKIAATLFFEPSTRTRLSFESAMLRRGGGVISATDAAVSSSSAKGESLEDTIAVVSGYADVIVLRHPQAGAAQRAAAVATVPVINAGDGDGEHPSQALLDLHCVGRELGHIDGIHIAFCGDLKHSRTVHSLLHLLRHYRNIHVSLIAPADLLPRADLLAELREAGVVCETVDALTSIATDVDVVYQTRPQTERWAAPNNTTSMPQIDRRVMDRLSRHAIVMHPLPRTDEIAPEVDQDPRAAYFRQAIGGVAVRMALLEAVLA